MGGSVYFVSHCGQALRSGLQAGKCWWECSSFSWKLNFQGQKFFEELYEHLPRTLVKRGWDLSRWYDPPDTGKWAGGRVHSRLGTPGQPPPFIMILMMVKGETNRPHSAHPLVNNEDSPLPISHLDFGPKHWLQQLLQHFLQQLHHPHGMSAFSIFPTQRKGLTTQFSELFLSTSLISAFSSSSLAWWAVFTFDTVFIPQF